MAIPTPDPATVDTITNVGGGGIGALLLAEVVRRLRTSGSVDKSGSGGDTDVQKLRDEIGGMKTQISKLETTVALSTAQGLDNEKGLARLEGEFHRMASSVESTMSHVQSELARIAGYMQAQSEMRAGRQASRLGDPTP
jgi:hypothetical protein